MPAGGNQLLGELPCRDRLCLGLVEVVRIPGESVSGGEPVDAEAAAGLLLSGVPLAALEKLNDGTVPNLAPPL